MGFKVHILIGYQFYTCASLLSEKPVVVVCSSVLEEKTFERHGI